MSLPVPVKPGIVSRLVQGPAGGYKLWFKNASPTIMVAAGCVGVVAGVVMACNATLKCDSVLSEIEADIEKVNHVREITDEDRYSENDYKHDMAIVYTKGGAKLARLYLPAAIVIFGSIALILGGHKILTNRHLALAAAYETLNVGYNNYRSRVREEYGDDKDREIAYGLKEEIVGEEVSVDEEGKKHKKKVKAQVPCSGLASPYAFYWDDTCTGHDTNPYYNESFLTAKQRDWNRKLAQRSKINGFVTLAEIKQDLGVMVYDGTERPTVRPGDHMVGWIFDPHYKPEEHDMKDQIDLGIFSPRNSGVLTDTNPVYILEPNVQGVLQDLAPNRRRW